MGINSTEVAYGFGQMGSAYLADTDAYEPPAGKVIVAITVLTDTTKFAELVPDTAGYLDGTTGADINGSTAYVGTSVVGANGTNADPIATATTFKAGISLVGRWTKVDLGAGSVLLYLADAR
jgi:hypothetical protein